MRLALIPARGGSKRIPHKNIRHFCGRPMLAWSVEAAVRSDCFDHIWVSTDDEAVADVARSCGAQVPFVRPAALADDHAGTVPVVQHAIRWARDSGLDPTEVCCLYATAAFVTAADLRRGWDLLQASNADYAFSVTHYTFPIQRALRLQAGRLAMFQPEHAATRSQDLEPAFHDAGQFYWGRASAWLAGTPVFSAASAPVMMPSHRVQDIDTPDDWRRAELMFQALTDSSP